MTITELIVCIVAGLGAGLGTGLAGLSAAAVVSPMLITFLHMPAYQAIGIALASDVLASGVSAWTYKKNKNIDIRHGVIMLISVLIFTLIGSFVSSLVPNGTMGGFSKGMTLLVGLKFMIRPIMTTKEVQANKSEEQKIRQSILCGVLIGFICGFVGAGGGMMMLLILTSVRGVRTQNSRWHKCIHYDFHRIYRRCLPFRHRRPAGSCCLDSVHHLHSDLGQNCCGIGQQSQHQRH